MKFDIINGINRLKTYLEIGGQRSEQYTHIVAA